MKRMLCYAHGLGCGQRRVHFEQQDVSRGAQYCDVKDDYEGPAFCSMECALIAGFMKLTFDTKLACPAHPSINHGENWICEKENK